MARGKQAALAATRRAESAHEVIDRLTDQLAEAKLRARRCESEAAAAPQLREEVARLRHQVTVGTSDELERVRAAAHRQVEKCQKDVATLVEIIVSSALEHNLNLTVETVTAIREITGSLDSVLDPTSHRWVKRGFSRKSAASLKDFLEREWNEQGIDHLDSPLLRRGIGSSDLEAS